LAEAIPRATETKKPELRGEHEISRKTIAQGRPGRSGEPVVTTLVCFLHFAREAAGASCARLSLRPLAFEGQDSWQDSSKNMLRDREAVSAIESVIAGLDPAIHQSSQESFFEVDGWPGQARP
jgi:hypothetical protein